MPIAEKLTRIKTLIGDTVRFDPPAQALSRWSPEIHAASSDDDSTINMYSQIGEDWWTGEGITAKLVSAVLRRNKGKEITVNINSPGGDFFEGNAIYNLLREHDGNVIVRVVGLAGSAASLIAMAGDEIKVAESGFLMIHNSWTIAVGNKEDMRDVADMLGQFDDSMVGVYTKKTGKREKEIISMMEAETFISGKDAVEMGFADALLDADEVTVEQSEKSGNNASLRKLEGALARAGMTRAERRDLFSDVFKDKPGAVQTATPSAGNSGAVKDALSGLLQTMKEGNSNA